MCFLLDLLGFPSALRRFPVKRYSSVAAFTRRRASTRGTPHSPGTFQDRLHSPSGCPGQSVLLLLPYVRRCIFEMLSYLLRLLLVSFALLAWYLPCCCPRRSALDGASGSLDMLGTTQRHLISVRNYTSQMIPVLASGACSQIFLGPVGPRPPVV